MKQKIGCWLHERWRTELVLRAPVLAEKMGISWLDLCNRSERLRIDLLSGGRICEWQDSSKLTVARMFPSVGLRLLKHTLEHWPIAFNFDLKKNNNAKPEVSILIAIGGLDRLPQFELTLACARAQQDVACEVIVVEQSPEPQLAKRLPPDVRYIKQLSVEPEWGFNKSWALNRAAYEARGKVFIILDGDLLIPTSFAYECCRILRLVEGVRPGRLLFYLNKHSTNRLIANRSLMEISGLDYVIANTPMPIAVRASTYWTIGGHDDAYFGWGGEDSEFLDRLRTRKVCEGGWLPVVHVWHPPALKKENDDRNRSLHQTTMAVDAKERIRRLQKLQLSEKKPRSVTQIA